MMWMDWEMGCTHPRPLRGGEIFRLLLFLLKKLDDEIEGEVNHPSHITHHTSYIIHHTSYIIHSPPPTHPRRKVIRVFLLFLPKNRV